MLPTEIWIVIANYMQNCDLYRLSLCSKDVYHSIKGILNIRRLIVKFVDQCALSYFHKYPSQTLAQYQPKTVCIPEYQIDFDVPYYKPYRLKSEDKYPWYVKRYVKTHWDLYFIPWQLGSSYERKLYLESNTECSHLDYPLIQCININIENMKAGRAINKSYPYFHKAEPGVTEKQGYIKQYRHPEHTVCYKCHLVCSYLDIIEVLTKYDVNNHGVYMWRPKAICSDCLEADDDEDYDVDLFD